MSIIAFFPWLQISQPYDFGAIKLSPYSVGAAKEAGLPDSVDKIISTYKTHSGSNVLHVSLISYNGSVVHDDFNEDDCEQILIFKEILTFVGLATREFFGLGIDYINSASFKCILQKFNLCTAGGDASLITRRRDGKATNYLSEGNVLFHCPHYVHSQKTLIIDSNLVTSLLNAVENNNDYAGIISLFNLANSDSEHLLERVEITLCVIALENMFGSGQEDIILNFRKENMKISNVKTIENSSRCITEEKKKIGNTNKYCQSLIEVWLKDLYRIRNKSAHGGKKNNNDFIWNEREHLLLFAYIFPYLVKIKLEADGFYSLSKADNDKILAIDYLLSCPYLFKKIETGIDGLETDTIDKESSIEGKNWLDWPWNLAVEEANEEISLRMIQESIEEVDKNPISN